VLGKFGGVIGPQLFQSRFAYNGYKTSFGICAAAIGAGWIANCWTWWLTRNVESDVRRVRRLRIEKEREGTVFSGEDVNILKKRAQAKGVL
jgi:hypothetical protein